MSVAVDGKTVRLSGTCTAEDAETLLALLVSGVRAVDLSDCDYLHGAVVQLLMAGRVDIIGEPAGFLGDWVIPLIRKQDSP
ncbi:hypothetical protein [Sphingomonas agri]|uniref:hypothetical protein n=1 Tax=Sphingomonas agri TaxID=1813878 RepID=UPI00311D3B9F